MTTAAAPVDIEFRRYPKHDDWPTETEEVVRLGKAWLVIRLKTLLQARRLHLPETPEAQALAAELLDFELRVDRNAHARFGAFRVGNHDDLVTALGLAVQHDAEGSR